MTLLLFPSQCRSVFVPFLFVLVLLFTIVHGDNNNPSLCGCPPDDCRGNAMCVARIEWLQEIMGYSEEAACHDIVQDVEFTNTCGVVCDPTKCSRMEEEDGSTTTTTTTMTTTNHPPHPGTTILCGCEDCYSTSWDAPGVGSNYTCGTRILWLMQVMKETEGKACRQVSSEFPDICGTKCHPSFCQNSESTSATSTTTSSSTSSIGATTSTTTLTKRARTPHRYHCGCEACTDEIWDSNAGGSSTCGDRIVWLQTVEGLAETAACHKVANEFAHGVCGPSCDPLLCDKNDNKYKHKNENGSQESDIRDRLVSDTEPAASSLPMSLSPHCGCNDCTDTVWTADAGGYTCGSRIEHLRDTENNDYPDEEAACLRVAGIEFPGVCGPGCDPTQCDGRTPPKPSSPRCGCNDCTDEVWETDAGGYTCGSRIEHLRDHESDDYPDEKAACLRVARFEFPDVCGPDCDPYRCDGRTPPPFTPSPTISPPGVPPLTPRSSLYCFPDVDEGRVRYKRVWKTHRIEVKEGNTCGPGDNAFSAETVSLKGHNLKLQFKKVKGVWTGSEVRVVHQGPTPFTYGTYFFSVKSVSVMNGKKKVSSRLPKDLVLGLFTWDDTDDFSVHQNWNHEVDIEISQWGEDDNEDVQFLVQPPGYPQMFRYNSNGDQGGQNYQFTWKPGEIAWSSSHGVSHVYSSKRAQRALEDDFVQCLPANVEIRMNLWNMHGKSKPSGFLSDSYRVEVEIDWFQYTPSSAQMYVHDGGYCGRHCHCSPESQCLSGKCVRDTSQQ